jgi:hypothetical protein
MKKQLVIKYKKTRLQPGAYGQKAGATLLLGLGLNVQGKGPKFIRRSKGTGRRLQRPLPPD